MDIEARIRATQDAAARLLELETRAPHRAGDVPDRDTAAEVDVDGARTLFMAVRARTAAERFVDLVALQARAGAGAGLDRDLVEFEELRRPAAVRLARMAAAGGGYAAGGAPVGGGGGRRFLRSQSPGPRSITTRSAEGAGMFTDVYVSFYGLRFPLGARATLDVSREMAATVNAVPPAQLVAQLAFDDEFCTFAHLYEELAWTACMLLDHAAVLSPAALDVLTWRADALHVTAVRRMPYADWLVPRVARESLPRAVMSVAPVAAGAALAWAALQLAVFARTAHVLATTTTDPETRPRTFDYYRAYMLVPDVDASLTAAAQGAAVMGLASWAARRYVYTPRADQVNAVYARLESLGIQMRRTVHDAHVESAAAAVAHIALHLVGRTPATAATAAAKLDASDEVMMDREDVEDGAPPSAMGSYFVQVADTRSVFECALLCLVAAEIRAPTEGEKIALYAYVAASMLAGSSVVWPQVLHGLGLVAAARQHVYVVAGQDVNGRRWARRAQYGMREVVMRDATTTTSTDDYTFTALVEEANGAVAFVVREDPGADTRRVYFAVVVAAAAAPPAVEAAAEAAAEAAPPTKAPAKGKGRAR